VLHDRIGTCAGLEDGNGKVPKEDSENRKEKAPGPGEVRKSIPAHGRLAD
jgi:hypothetical protein